jgi:hypothetical protein
VTPYFFFFTGFSGGEVPPAPVQTATPGFEPRKRRKTWVVRTPWGKREEYETAAQAYARYAELFEGAKPATAKAKAKARSRVMAPQVEYEGIDLGAAFARLARDNGGAIGRQVAADIAAQLAAIEARARREAEDRDDEEALLLLLN